MENLIYINFLKFTTNNGQRLIDFKARRNTIASKKIFGNKIDIARWGKKKSDCIKTGQQHLRSYTNINTECNNFVPENIQNPGT